MRVVVEGFTLLSIPGPTVSKDTTAELFVDVGEVSVLDRGNVFGQDLLAIGIGLDGRGVLVEDIDLLEGKSLSFGDEEVGEDEATQTSATPDEEHFGTEVGIARSAVDEGRSRVSDSPVEEPVGSGGEGDTLATDVEGENLANDDPCDRSPSGGEEGNIDTDKCHKGLLTGVVGTGECNTEDGDEVLADTHASGTDKEKLPSANTVNGKDTGDGHADVDNIGGDSDQEGLLDTGGGEESSTIIEDEVDTSELLPRLDSHTAESSEKDLVLTHLEAISPGRVADFLLLAQTHLDVLDFLGDFGVVSGYASQTLERLGSLDIFTSPEEPTRRLRQIQKTTSEDEGPDELDGDGDLISGVVVPAVTDLGEDGGEEETNSDGELVARDDGTTNPSRSTFRLVHGD